MRSPGGSTVFDSSFSDRGVLTVPKTGLYQILVGGYIAEPGEGPGETRSRWRR